MTTKSSSTSVMRIKSIFHGIWQEYGVCGRGDMKAEG